MKKSLIYITIAAMTVGCSTSEKSTDAAAPLTDSAPLHLLTPDYTYAYGVPSADSIKAKMHDIYVFLASSTPTEVIDRNTGAVITDYSRIDSTSEIKRGAFRLTSYEWGVLYAAMLRAGEITGDTAYTDYAVDRMKFLNALYPYTSELYAKGMLTDRQMRQFTHPEALDDGGAICAAMIKAQAADSTLDFSAMIDNYSDYVINKEHRLSDGTFARNRPHV
ncbi:MAG: glycoside hydrolase family 88 protein, partial [Muribaculaceae bacterium]|nr:glycoside hydrolase family 88 protein [Muribaculaceae bacterium]